MSQPHTAALPQSDPEAWAAYQRAVGKGMGPAKASWPTWDVFRQGFAAGRGSCDRDCCAQQAMDLEETKDG